MKSNITKEVLEEKDILFKIASMASTTKEFVPIRGATDAPSTRLASLVTRLRAHGSIDPELTRHAYIVNIAEEIVRTLRTHDYDLKRMIDLLFHLYLTSIVAHFSLVDRYGMEDSLSGQFSDRTEAIIWGWTLKGANVDEKSSSELVAKVKDFYRQQRLDVEEMPTNT
jgi:hypothetical protein